MPTYCSTRPSLCRYLHTRPIWLTVFRVIHRELPAVTTSAAAVVAATAAAAATTAAAAVAVVAAVAATAVVVAVAATEVVVTVAVVDMAAEAVVSTRCLFSPGRFRFSS